MNDEALREQLVRLLDWQEAHVSFEDALKDLPSDKRGARAPGFEHSVWELLEHMRIAQEDITTGPGTRSRPTPRHGTARLRRSRASARS